MHSSPKVRHVVAWLPAVRWAMGLALWAALVASALLPSVDFPLRTIAPLALAAAICRTGAVVVARGGHAVPRWLTGWALAADAALLTGLLDITGGPFNPFIVMYLVYVWFGLAAVSMRWAAIAATVSIAGFTWLVVDHLQAGLLEHHRLNDFPTHLFTMLFAGGSVAELVAHYVERSRAALAERQRLLDDARERAARSERLAALTTLAAGAAHELSTPLATIAVASRELERSAGRLAESSGVVDAIQEDARLIRTEIDRCHLILDGMSGRASHTLPTEPAPLSARAIAELAQSRLTEEQRRRLRVEIVPGAGRLDTEPNAVVQALTSLLKNAFDASGSADPVVLRVQQNGPMLRLEVHDRGAGMSDDVRRRAGEPFFTTKPPNRGYGLGLFLARSVAERIGGSLQISGDQGTTAVLEIPASVNEMAASRAPALAGASEA